MGGLLFLSIPTAEGYGFVHAHRYSKPELVSGRGYLGSGRCLEGYGVEWSGVEMGEKVGGREGKDSCRDAVWGWCSDIGLSLCARDGLFLGMRFVPQEPVYLHHHLRRQLAQHL